MSGEPRPCLHPRARHKHGERLAYALDKCRCVPCKAANAAYEGRRAKLRAYGRPTTPWVDATPVRAHVEQLQVAGLGWRPIADRAGVANGVVSRLLFGKTNGERFHGPSKRINPTAAARLLAVPLPGVDGLLPGARTDGTGTRRRLQALVAIGWSQTYLAGRLGMAVGNLNSLITGRKCDEVTAATARAVVALYDELWEQPAPAGHGRTRALIAARKRGWLPPMAWDDDAIDNPKAGPAEPEPEPAVVLRGPGRRTDPEVEEQILYLTSKGASARDIADRLGVTARTVQRVRSRQREQVAA